MPERCWSVAQLVGKCASLSSLMRRQSGTKLFAIQLALRGTIHRHLYFTTANGAPGSRKTKPKQPETKERERRTRTTRPFSTSGKAPPRSVVNDSADPVAALCDTSKNLCPLISEVFRPRKWERIRAIVQKISSTRGLVESSL